MGNRFLRQWLFSTLVLYVALGVAVVAAAGILALAPLLLLLVPLIAIGLTCDKVGEGRLNRMRSRVEHQEPVAAVPRVGPCLNCRYFSNNSVLPCAVNPSSFPRGCREFEQK